MKIQTMKVDADTAAPVLVRDGAHAYARALQTANGKELSALARAGERSAVCAAVYSSPPYELRVPPLSVARLSINLTSAFVNGGIDGDRFRGFKASRYSLFFTPADVAVNWCKDSPSRHLNVYFRCDAFDAGDDDALPFNEEPVFNACVPGIGQLADQLVHELDSPTLLSADAADSLGRLMFVRMARHRHRTTESNGLTPKKLAVLRDYVMANLSGRILVADLARQVNLSANRFALCYSERTGESPHRFVMMLRLEQAAAMLRQAAPSVAEVAQACGFANQQHLSNAMRRHLGTTPSRYRALHRNAPGG